MAFVSKRSPKKGESTLHVLPAASPGETLTVATMKDGLGDVAWSPDGRWIAFAGRTPDERYDAEDESWQAPRKIERFLTKLDDEGWVYDRPRHIYVIAADGTGTPRNLTPGEFQHGSFTWKADSSGLVVSGQRHPTWDLDFAHALYSVPLHGEITALSWLGGSYQAPSMSPDGTNIAFAGADDSQTYPQNVHVGLLPLAGGDHRWLSRQLDRTFETTVGRCIGDVDRRHRRCCRLPRIAARPTSTGYRWMAQRRPPRSPRVRSPSTGSMPQAGPSPTPRVRWTVSATSSCSSPATRDG